MTKTTNTWINHMYTTKFIRKQLGKRRKFNYWCFLAGILLSRLDQAKQDVSDAEHDINQYMEINKQLLNEMPCYRQWLYLEDDDPTCIQDDIDTENYCPACKLNSELQRLKKH